MSGRSNTGARKEIRRWLNGALASELAPQPLTWIEIGSVSPREILAPEAPERQARPAANPAAVRGETRIAPANCEPRLAGTTRTSIPGWGAWIIHPLPR
jgi:hypothetical protein